MSLSRQMKYCFQCRKTRWHEPTMDGGWACSTCHAVRPKPEKKMEEKNHESPTNHQPQG
ncbi:MAG TPA: hypothetical protein PK360_00025 [bacterium]|jgi:hypothetical protein|nr:hypothetical protein [bacterium]